MSYFNLMVVCDNLLTHFSCFLTSTSSILKLYLERSLDPTLQNVYSRKFSTSFKILMSGVCENGLGMETGRSPYSKRV